MYTVHCMDTSQVLVIITAQQQQGIMRISLKKANDGPSTKQKSFSCLYGSYGDTIRYL